MHATLNGLPVEVRKYEGIGKLNVQTSRGEVQASHGDYIVNFHDGSSAVLPGSTLEALCPEVCKREKEPEEKSEDESRYEKAVEEINEKLEGSSSSSTLSSSDTSAPSGGQQSGSGQSAPSIGEGVQLDEMGFPNCFLSRA